MKKVTLLFVCLTFGGFLANAQSPIGKGGRQLNFGLGLSNSGLPVYVSYDFGVHEDITVAPQIQFNLDGFDYMVFSGRGDYHFNSVFNIPSDTWDLYAGANVGFTSYFGDGKDNVSGLDGGLQIGGRWYWSDSWGLNLEFAGGRGFGTKLGLSYRM